MPARQMYRIRPTACTKGVTGNLAAHHRRRSTPSPSPYNPQPLLPAEKNNTSREMNIPLLSYLGVSKGHSCSITRSMPTVRSRRATSLPLTSLAAHWASASLYPPLAALSSAPISFFRQVNKTQGVINHEPLEANPVPTAGGHPVAEHCSPGACGNHNHIGRRHPI